MDIKDIVFNAARDGRLHQLKAFLEDTPSEEVFSLVSARTNGSTPLVMACRNGHLDTALYLVAKCNADIEQVGSVTFDDGIIKLASPIWCAAATGNLMMVQMLVTFNASVNSTTECNETALHASCLSDQIEIAEYLIQHGADFEIAKINGISCLMNTCYLGYYKISKYLLECGADMDRKSSEGNTALHYCAQRGNLDIVKMLLQCGSKSQYNSSGTTPLLKAAISGHSQVVEYLIHYFNCAKQDNVNALELLGSSFTRTNNFDMVKAFEFWKRAMELRYEDGEFPLEKPTTRYPIASCIAATEVRTLHQLEELVSDPDEMCIQALLIVERILGPNHEDVFLYIKHVVRRYFDNNSFHRCVCLLMYELDLQLQIQKAHNYSTLQLLSQFVLLFYYMTQTHLEADSFQNILQVFERCLRIIERELYVPRNRLVENDTNLHDTLIAAIYMLGMMCRLQPHLNIYKHKELRKAVYKFVRLNRKGKNGWTVLHVACYRDTSMLAEHFSPNAFPFLEVVEILLEVGACPNAADAANNTPLHVAAMNVPFSPAIFKALLNHGAHLDFCNNGRKTPLQLAETIPLSDVYPMRYINLQCLCAQAIRKHEIAYERYVHEELKEFLDSH